MKFRLDGEKIVLFKRWASRSRSKSGGSSPLISKFHLDIWKIQTEKPYRYPQRNFFLREKKKELSYISYPARKKKKKTDGVYRDVQGETGTAGDGREDCSEANGSIRLGAVRKKWCAILLQGCLIQEKKLGNMCRYIYLNHQ